MKARLPKGMGGGQSMQSMIKQAQKIQEDMETLQNELNEREYDIAAGGGAVTVKENYAPLHQNGRIYQLFRPLELLPTAGRPISQGNPIEELYARRAPLYEAFADKTVNNTAAPAETAEEIWRDFCEHSGD